MRHRRARSRAFAQAAEGLGYDALWYPEGTGFESLSFAAFVLSETERLCAASGIANIYARDAVAAIAGHDTLNHFYGDRFVLGLGVSHVPLVEGFRGHSYAKPVATMRAPTSMPWTGPRWPSPRRSGTWCSRLSGPGCWRWLRSARGARTLTT